MNVKCFLPADILIPENTDMSKWSVIACDQYTSQPEYWEEVAAVVGNAPSAFNVILPEAYLDKANTDEHIAKINRTMYEYMKIMKEYKNAFIYVERTLKNGKTRCGLIGMVDLEEYDFSENSSALIRATEGTVLDRIPPRLMVRRDAPLELPHVMLLANDPERTIIEPLSAMTDSMQKIYDFELMQRGGHIKGYLVPESYHEKIINAYAALADVDVFNKKNKTSCTHPLLFAAGDGNHSLATAKDLL